jgi:hypothetical protein
MRSFRRSRNSFSRGVAKPSPRLPLNEAESHDTDTLPGRPDRPLQRLHPLRLRAGINWDNPSIYWVSELQVKAPRLSIRRDSGLQPDSSQFSSIKAVLEQILGSSTYAKLKETGTLSDWKKTIIKMLCAIELSIDATVQIADAEWRNEIRDILKGGRDRLASTKSIDEVFARLSATLIQIVFTQIGRVPSRHRIIQRTVPLKAKYWTLNGLRSVQYVQNLEQQDNMRGYVERRETQRARLELEEP